MKKMTSEKELRARVLTAGFYLVVSGMIIGLTLWLCLSGRQGAVQSATVSSSHVTVTRSDVSPGFFAGEETTAKGSSSDLTSSTPDEKAVKHQDDDFVRVRDYIPDIEVELMYATDRNFTGQVIYEFSDAWLRYGTVKKLAKAQEKLKEQGMRIKIWDAFRPVSAQFKLWKVYPHARYVSNPNKGFSSHSRGNTVDVTLVDDEGNEVTMPTGFDSFSRLADRNYSDVKDKTAVANARLLEKTMSRCGFKPYSGEWWHFSDRTVYEVAKDYVPE